MKLWILNHFLHKKWNLLTVQPNICANLWILLSRNFLRIIKKTIKSRSFQNPQGCMCVFLTNLKTVSSLLILTWEKCAYKYNIKYEICELYFSSGEKHFNQSTNFLVSGWLWKNTTFGSEEKATSNFYMLNFISLNRRMKNMLLSTTSPTIFWVLFPNILS